MLIGKDPDPGEIPELYAVNDTAFEQKGTWKAAYPDGKEIASGTFEADPNGIVRIGALPVPAGQCCFLEWNCGTFSGKITISPPANLMISANAANGWN